MDRRKFLKIFGGGAMTTAAVLTGCKSKTKTKAVEEYKQQVEPPVGKMTLCVSTPRPRTRCRYWAMV